MPSTRNASLARRMAELIDGKAIAQQVRDEVRDEVAAWVAAGHEPPGLATILVGDDPASAVYVNGKQKASAEVGIRGFDHRLRADTPHGEVRALLHELNADPAVNGILLQLPTPPQVDGPALTEEIAPGQGRRRADADLHRPAGQGPPGPAPVHAARAHGAAAPPRRERSRAPRRSSSAAPTSSASRSPRCCSRPTPPSPPRTRARATSPRSAAARTSSSPPSASPT